MQQKVKPFQRLAKTQNEKIKRLIQFMKEDFSANHESKMHVLRSYINILLFDLQTLYARNSTFMNVVTLHEKIVNFDKLLDIYFIEIKSPSQYAEKLHVSENYLNKLCKQYKHKTVGELIRERVMTEAQRLLYHTQETVAQIADRLGFETSSYFITFFKKYAALTPEDFRKQYKK